MIGTMLGHYRIIQSLGRGGMGEVFIAEDTKLGRRVALKLIPAEVAADPERRRRFEREARAVAALNHPNIVTIHSVEEIEGRPFLTLELVEGTTLAAIIRKGGLPLEQFMTLALPLADALSAAHQRGIVHRDLKPANVMVSLEGRVKVLDFGLARLVEPVRPGAVPGGLATLTMTGEGRILGTVAYMSPEQAEGKPVDGRSDIFSLGILLFEMATGERPFQGSTSASVLSAIIKDTPPSINDLNPALPRDLGRIVKRALTKDQEHRYQTAKDLRNDLQELKAEMDAAGIAPVPTTQARVQPAVPRHRRRAFLIASGTIAALVLVGIGVWLLLGRDGPTPPQSPVESFRMTRVTTGGNAALADISPDGRYVVHVVDEGDQQSLWIRQVATSSNVQIVPSGKVRFESITFSSDGNFVYYVAITQELGISTIYQIPVLGGTPRKIASDVSSRVAFSPDGRRMAFHRYSSREDQSSVILLEADGSGERVLASLGSGGMFSRGGPAWSPDGKSICIGAREASGTAGQRVFQIRVEDGQIAPLGNRVWRRVGGLAWASDGREVFVVAWDPADAPGAQIWALIYPGGAARRITNDLSSYAGVSLTADARSLLTVQNDTRTGLWVFPKGDTRRAHPVTTEGASLDGIDGLRWMPDGRLVYASFAGRSNLFIVEATGQGGRQVTSGGATDPAISPDGRSIAFISARDGSWRIWVMDADGGGARALTAGPRDLYPAFAPDGKSVIFCSLGTPGGWRKQISLDGGNPGPVAFSGAPPVGTDGKPIPFHVLEVSPDGRLLAVLSYDASRTRVSTVALATTEQARTFDFGANDPHFTVDSRALSYIDTREGASNIWVQPLDGGAPRKVTDFTSGRIFTHAWSPDGRSLAVSRGRVTSDVVLISNLRRSGD